jgi:hypothetical protein
MLKASHQISLFVVVLVTLFGLLALPNLADKPAPPLSLTKSSVSSQVSSFITTPLTFTPVATIYLPIVSSAPSPDSLNITIELPGGTTYKVGENIEMIITVSSSKGVDEFTWGVFTKNLNSLLGGDQSCGGATECKLTKSFSLPVAWQYLIGVDAIDTEGKIVTKRVEFFVE